MSPLPLVFLFFGVVLVSAQQHNDDFLALTVASESTDGFNRYLRSAKINNINGKVLGLGEPWLGGDMNFAGGAYKINLLKKELENYKDNDDQILLFSDSYDVVFTDSSDAIVSKFKEIFPEARIVFGAEGFCWPDSTLEEQYPPVEEGKRFLNSGGFMGYAKDLYEMVSYKEIDNKGDDQLYYTKIYLDKELRQKWKIQLDHKSQIFQNLNGAVADVELRFKGTEPYLQNIAYDTIPSVIHGNGPSKIIFNSLTNYIPKAWNKDDQCTACWEDTLNFSEVFAKETPKVVIALFIEQPTPFLEEFFQKVEAIDYPKSRIDLFIHNTVPEQSNHVSDFVERVTNLDEMYDSVTVVAPEEDLKEWHARNKGIEKCVEVKCDYYLSIDSEAHLDNAHTLKLLIEQNRKVVAPMLVRPFKAWSNFWGALTTEGFYARSTDYMEIVQNSRRGLWNVPFISAVYLIQGKLIQNEDTRPNFVHRLLDADMAFCQNLRENDVHFFVSNRVDFGHLINADEFDVTRLHPELWEIMTNRYDWEQRYLHENYSQSLEPEAKIAQPCPDVFWFPLVKHRYADELVAVMENFGQWSNGQNQDPRLEGGYENVPTRDIHMNQVGYERQWLHLLDTYVRPLQETVFDGYLHAPPRSIMNFVVRYRPDEQPSLRPHHDASTYTINLALNNAGEDFTGGGCRFLRYDCSVPDTKKGWILMHPGRLTHYHEGLETTSGTRYIMISFIDP